MRWWRSAILRATDVGVATAPWYFAAMNVQALTERRAHVKLTVDTFLLLRQAGVFAAFSKSELLDGKLWGVPVQDDEEPESDAVVPIKLRVADYIMLDEAGAFDGHDDTELVDGVVYPMSPQFRRHGYLKDELAYRLRRSLEAIDAAWHVATEQSVQISDVDQPQPDIILTTEPRGNGPIPLSSVGLLVEVSDSTLKFDRDKKGIVYAAAGVPEYWVADANARVLHRMWSPAAGTYGAGDEIHFGSPITAATIPGLTIATTDL